MYMYFRFIIMIACGSILCEVHGFTHAITNDSCNQSLRQYTFINILRKVNIEGKNAYCRYLASVCHSQTYYVLEMGEECPNGLSNTNISVLKLNESRVVLVAKATFGCDLSSHLPLQRFSYKMIDTTSVCCSESMNRLVSSPNIVIGVKCQVKRTPYNNCLGTCKWIGKVNGIECVGIEMTNWISNECSGYCFGIKMFDCRHGYGIIVHSSEVEIFNSNELLLSQNGLIDLRYIFNVDRINIENKDLVNIGRRVIFQVINYDKYGNYYNVPTRGTVKWIGQINDEPCAGIESDFPFDGGMDGVLSTSESFDCESRHGAICPTREVAFDYIVYNVEFTVDEAFNINSTLINAKTWDQKIVYERNLKMNAAVYVNITQSDIIFSAKGKLRWLGYIQQYSVAILEMDNSFPITSQQMRIKEILKDANSNSHIFVQSKYLYKYRTIKSYEIFEFDMLNFGIGDKTEFGTVKWRGVDENDFLYYGFEMDSSSNDGGNGTFQGQQLFQCPDGLGLLISAKEVHQSLILKTVNTPETNNSVEEPRVDWLEMVVLLATLADKHHISTNDLLSTVADTQNINILVPLVNKLSQSINIYLHPKIITQLLVGQSFDTLLTALSNWPVNHDNDKQLLTVAVASLKYKRMDLFEQCMNKCTNKDALLDDGETFLTQIIKDRVDQPIIVKAIESYDFDLTKANKDNSIPLTVACTNMMMDVVECIIKNIKVQEVSKKVCSICLDRDISIVFNCGHNSCKKCSTNLVQCHLCKTIISSRGKLYLN